MLVFRFSIAHIVSTKHGASAQNSTNSNTASVQPQCLRVRVVTSTLYNQLSLEQGSVCMFAHSAAFSDASMLIVTAYLSHSSMYTYELHKVYAAQSTAEWAIALTMQQSWVTSALHLRERWHAAFRCTTHSTFYHMMCSLGFKPNSSHTSVHNHTRRDTKSVCVASGELNIHSSQTQTYTLMIHH